MVYQQNAAAMHWSTFQLYVHFLFCLKYLKLSFQIVKSYLLNKVVAFYIQMKLVGNIVAGENISLYCLSYEIVHHIIIVIKICLFLD